MTLVEELNMLSSISVGISVTAVVLAAINVSMCIMKLVFPTKKNEDDNFKDSNNSNT